MRNLFKARNSPCRSSFAQLGIGATPPFHILMRSSCTRCRGGTSRLARRSTREHFDHDATQFSTYGTSLPNYEDYRDQNTVFSGLASVTFSHPPELGGQAEPNN